MYFCIILLQIELATLLLAIRMDPYFHFCSSHAVIGTSDTRFQLWFKLNDKYRLYVSVCLSLSNQSQYIYLV